MIFVFCVSLFGACFINIADGSEFKESTLLSDTLKWKYNPVNPNCTDATGGRNPCQDVRICKFAVASLMLGGWPTLCGWVGKGVPKVCCGLPLVLGGGLMAKIEAEKSRKRECGRRTWSLKLSETENKFFDTLKTLPPIDTSNPEKYDPPLDLSVEPMMSSYVGSSSRQGHFPWMVAIYKGSSFQCGGSLIDRVHVLSAAHCFISNREFVDPSLYSVRVGNINADMGYPFAVSSIKIHEKYNRKQNYNDIAILTLSTEILTPRIAHICLPDETLQNMDFTGKKMTRLGWDNTESVGKNTPFLRIVDNIPIVSQNKCAIAYSSVSNPGLPFKIDNSIICGGTPESGDGACRQYPGGLLMYKNNNQDLVDFHPDIPWVLVGIVSFGVGCDGQSGIPDGYTRVSSFMNWITENTKSPQL